MYSYSYIGENSKHYVIVLFPLVSQAGNFNIDNATGSVTVEMMFDVETMSTLYTLVVLAVDGGMPPRR